MNQSLPEKIAAALASLDGIQRAEAPADLWDQLQQRIEALSPTPAKLIPMRKVWQAAAAIALMAVLNIAILAYAQHKTNLGNASAAGTETLSNAYFNDPLNNY
jgi:hypothetical protein